MKIFHCGHCQQLIFFENSRCVSCDHPLAYLRSVDVQVAQPPAATQWAAPAERTRSPLASFGKPETGAPDHANGTAPLGPVTPLTSTPIETAGR
jgi:hypothetical protein